VIRHLADGAAGGSANGSGENMRIRAFGCLAVAVAIAALLTAAPAGAAKPKHCVVAVTSVSSTGEMHTTSPTCFDRFSDAMSFAGLPPQLAAMSPAQLAASPQALSTFTIGTHYDGAGWTGSSISVTGSDCSGGWLNLSSSWINRISSTANGCPRIRHFNGNNLTGSSETTFSPGGNLFGLDNQTNSIQYLS
jgi:hypothetical protein